MLIENYLNYILTYILILFHIVVMLYYPFLYVYVLEFGEVL